MLFHLISVFDESNNDKEAKMMLVVRIIAKICSVVLNIMFFAAMIGIVATMVDRDLSGVIQTIIMAMVVFFARIRVAHFLAETQGKSYRYEGIFARYYKGYYIDLITFFVALLFAGLAIFAGVYTEWWME